MPVLAETERMGHYWIELNFLLKLTIFSFIEAVETFDLGRDRLNLTP